MGADFSEKAAKSFKKSWDRARVDLATADLFTREPECAARTAEADLVGNARLAIGETLIVEVEDGSLVARKANTTVARFTNPSADLLSAVAMSCGVAKGVVCEVHSLANVAEISLC